MSEIIGKCRCGGYVRWIPMFGPNRDLGGCDKCKEFKFFADANITSQPAAAHGWVMVPREPTAAMLDACCATAEDDEAMRQAYASMLAAAPQPQEVTVSDVCAALDRIPLSERKPLAECQCAKCDSSGELHWRCTCVKDPSITCIVHPRKPRDLQWLEDAAEDAEQLTTPPAHGDGEGVEELNRRLGEAFKDDPANAVRAHAAVLPLIRALTTRPTTEAQEARDWLADALANQELIGPAAHFRPEEEVIQTRVLRALKKHNAALALPAQGEG